MTKANRVTTDKLVEIDEKIMSNHEMLLDLINKKNLEVMEQLQKGQERNYDSDEDY